MQVSETALLGGRQYGLHRVGTSTCESGSRHLAAELPSGQLPSASRCNLTVIVAFWNVSASRW